jgi:hypothetical protein
MGNIPLIQCKGKRTSDFNQYSMKSYMLAILDVSLLTTRILELPRRGRGGTLYMANTNCNLQSLLDVDIVSQADPLALNLFK